MDEEVQLSLIRDMFFLSKKGRVPSEEALKKIEQKIPGLSKWKRGHLLKKCFDGRVKHNRPGKSKNVKDGERKYYYYGIELAVIKRAGKEERTKSSSRSLEPNRTEINGMSREELGIEMSCLRRENEKLKLENAKLSEQLAKMKTIEEQGRALLNTQNKKTHNIVPNIDIPRSFYVDHRDIDNGTNIIGRGSFGTCHVAEYKGLTVVIKTLRNRENLVKEKLKALVEDEAKCMLTVQAHRNLPHLIGLCIKGGNFFLLMNFWGSRPSTSRPSSLTAAEALRGKFVCSIPWIDVLKQVAEGLGAIHDSGIIHNDIKGDNIVLREDQGFHPVIIDFGKATRIGEARTKYHLTKEGQLRWKKKYPWVAPELLNNADWPSPVTDVYSFGYCVRDIEKKFPNPILREIVRLTVNVVPAKRASISLVKQVITGS